MRTLWTRKEKHRLQARYPRACWADIVCALLEASAGKPMRDLSVSDHRSCINDAEGEGDGACYCGRWNPSNRRAR